ncbi:hypothetical protein NKH18_11265 [Streptomyces sp. M10(2022)]
MNELEHSVIAADQQTAGADRLRPFGRGERGGESCGAGEAAERVGHVGGQFVQAQRGPAGFPQVQGERGDGGPQARAPSPGAAPAPPWPRRSS